MIDPGAITINDILAVAAVLFGLSKIYDWIFEKLFRPKNLAEKRIKDLEDAQKAISEDVLLVDSFLNHQMDISLMEEIGREFKRRFAGKLHIKVYCKIHVTPAYGRFFYILSHTVAAS